MYRKINRYGYNFGGFINKMGPIRLPLKILRPDAIPFKGVAENNKGIFLTGTPRSGTSWISKIISLSDDILYWREPYNPANVSLMKQQFYYLKNDMEDISYKKFTDLLFKGMFTGFSFDYTDKKQMKKLNRRHRHLIKDPTAPFILDWITSKYDLDVVIVVRHPAGFVSSIIKLGWNVDFNIFLRQERLLADLIGPYKQLLVKYNYRKMDVAKGAVFWCIINFVLWEYIKKYQYVWIRYEDICNDPIKEFKRLFNKINLTWNEQVEKTLQSSISSNITFSDNITHKLERNTKKMANIWIERLTSEKLQIIQDIVSIFDLPFYESY